MKKLRICTLIALSLLGVTCLYTTPASCLDFKAADKTDTIAGRTAAYNYTKVDLTKMDKSKIKLKDKLKKKSSKSSSSSSGSSSK